MLLGAQANFNLETGNALEASNGCRIGRVKLSPIPFVGMFWNMALAWLHDTLVVLICNRGLVITGLYVWAGSQAHSHSRNCGQASPFGFDAVEGLNQYYGGV